MKSTILAAMTVFTLANGAASAQTAPSVATPESASTVPVPGNNSGIDSTVPAAAASEVVTSGDAPVASTAEATSKVPVPGNNSGIDSTMPVDAASTVVVGSDAAPVPTTPASPVPGNSAGETAAPAN
ncbi:hypothetical protein [Aureimonas sp. ME7]|uniref:hypothetical protein n=1 Tax=Aureimonas sp. ME7 TaxID=2744252 RepID=UPI0015F5219D|nr:hypothetical protein [Aureimonas sp. ME7]